MHGRGDADVWEWEHGATTEGAVAMMCEEASQKVAHHWRCVSLRRLCLTRAFNREPTGRPRDDEKGRRAWAWHCSQEFLLVSCSYCGTFIPRWGAAPPAWGAPPLTSAAIDSTSRVCGPQRALLRILPPCRPEPC